jgi:hypothetical protein
MSNLCFLGLAAVACVAGAFLGWAAVTLYFRFWGEK